MLAFRDSTNGAINRWLFLTAYAAAAGLDREEARKLWREGRAAQIRRHARNAKRQGA